MRYEFKIPAEEEEILFLVEKFQAILSKYCLGLSDKTKIKIEVENFRKEVFDGVNTIKGELSVVITVTTEAIIPEVTGFIPEMIAKAEAEAEKTEEAEKTQEVPIEIEEDKRDPRVIDPDQIII